MSPSISVRLLLTQSDARLLELARDGHERAFEALVQRYRRPLLHYCRRLLLANERAEDALQHGLLRAWLALQNGHEVRDVRPWLYRVVHNSALNTLRVSGYDYATLSDTLRGADAPEEDLDRRITVREAFAGLAALPEMQREALLRTAIDGHSHEEVARALGLSEGALRGLVYRARASLRTAVTAVTPSPVVNWALSHRTAASGALGERLAELAAGGGSVGAGGLLLKGGAVVVTVGALAGSITTAHHRSHAQLSASESRQQTGPLTASVAADTTATATAPAKPALGGGVGARRSHGGPPAARPLHGERPIAAVWLTPPGPRQGQLGRQDGQQPDSQHLAGQPLPAVGGDHEAPHQSDTKTQSGTDGKPGDSSTSGSGPSAGSVDSGTTASSDSGGSGSTSDATSGSGQTTSTSDSSGTSSSDGKFSFLGEPDGGALMSEPSGGSQSTTDGSGSSGGSSSSSGG